MYSIFVIIKYIMRKDEYISTHKREDAKSNAQWNHWPEQLLCHFHGNQSRPIIMISDKCGVRFEVRVYVAVPSVYFVSPFQHRTHIALTHRLLLNVALVDVDDTREIHQIFQHIDSQHRAFYICNPFYIYFIRKLQIYKYFQITMR